MSYTQDWKPCVLTKNPRGKAPKNSRGLAKAKRNGDVQTVKKFNGGTNRRGGITNAGVIENEQADFRHKSITQEFKQCLVRARAAKKLSQKQLAQKCNLQASVIRDYENGSAIPNPQVIRKLGYALGVTLPKVKKPKKAKD